MHKKKIKALQGIAPTAEELQKLLKLCESEEIKKSDKEVIVSAIKLITDLRKAHEANDMDAAAKILQSLRDDISE